MAVCCVCNKPSSANPNSNRLIQCLKCKLFVHKECYGVVASNVVDQWLCQRCLHGEGNERCHLCPFQDGALKKTDNGGWAHILCAQYIPEVIFGNNFSMEPINLAEVPRPRFQQICYVCDEQGNHVNKRLGACMQCNVQNCTSCFHVTCGQRAGLLVAEDCDDRRIVDYYGFCSLHVRNAGKTPEPPAHSPEAPSLQSISSYVGYYPPTTAPYTATQRPKEGEKISLPSVSTLPSSQLKNLNHLLPTLNINTSMRPDSQPAKMRPVQPRVRAYPLPFQGVHQQTNISLTADISQSSELKYLPVEGQTEEYLPAPSLISTSGSGITSSTTSSVCSGEGQKKRKVSSSTDTAESEGGMEHKEPLEETLQKIISDGSTSKLKIASEQGGKEQKISDEAEGYNDLSTLFKSKKTKKKKLMKELTVESEDKPESDYSDYLPDGERKRSAFSKKGKKSKKSSKDPFKRSKSVKMKSPKYKARYRTPPKTPNKVQQSSLLCGAKGYSPAALVGAMLSEGKDSDQPASEKLSSNKPLISMDCFFDRMKEMGMQYMIKNAKSDKTKQLMTELKDLNQVNSYLANQLKAKAAQLDHLRKLNARLAVPFTTPLKPLPDPAPHSKHIAKLLKAVHDPLTFANDVVPEPADETLVEEREEEKKEIIKPVEVKEEEVLEIPTHPVHPVHPIHPIHPTQLEVVQEVRSVPSVEEIKPPVAPEEAPQIIIAGDPPVAWTCNKDGTVVGYKPSEVPSLHTDQYKGDISRLIHQNKAQYKDMSQFNKVVEQQYKEKLLAQQGAYFEAQRRQYEGLLQHQLQTKMQGSQQDYLTQAYLDNWGSHAAAGYYYAQHPGAASTSQQQEMIQRQMPPLTAHFPPQAASQSALNTISTFSGLQTSRPPSTGRRP